MDGRSQPRPHGWAAGGTGGLDDVIEAAHRVAAAGMDPMRYLETEDGLVRAFMFRIAELNYERQQQRDENLAQMIINKLAKAFRA